jgi:hypothetical protein
LLLIFSSFQYEYSITYPKKASCGEPPPTEPLGIYGIFRKNERKRNVKLQLQIELESLEKMSKERGVKLQIELEAMLDKKKLGSSKK